MDAIPNDIMPLIYRSLSGELSASEQATLDAWLGQSEKRRAFYADLQTEEQLAIMLSMRTPERESILDQELFNLIELKRNSSSHPQAVHRIHFLRTAWFRYAAAAIIVVGAGAYLWDINHNAAVKQTTSVAVHNDIAPGSSKAVLTLSDGQKVELNNTGTEIIKDGELLINNNAGELVYQNSDVAAMNTMTTPNGGQYQLTLEDGTKVWLNAASSITYPTAFKGNTREVNITGEAYFEVAQNKSKPFIVNTIKDKITVMGTRFNIYGYAGEVMKTSLIDGAVKIGKTILQPGEAYANGKTIATNVDQDIAWKNGLFHFSGSDVASMMREIGRWYDLDVVYASSPKKRNITGKMQRNLTLRQLINILDGLDLHCRLEGKQLILAE